MDQNAAPGRELAALLQPRSVALIGVSDDPKKFAGSPVRVAKESGFAGAIYPVNPARGTIGDLRAYGAVTEIEGTVDLALIVVPRDAVHDALEQCGRKGVRAAVVLTSGFADAGERGTALQAQLAETARRYGMRVVGPNCTGCFIGAAQLPLGTSAAFPTGRFESGTIGFITQSGAIGTALLALADARGLGPRFWFSTGNEMDLTVADFLEAGLEDSDVRAFCLYLETIRDVPRFARAASAALAQGKPVIALKVGTSTLGAEKAQAHTGAMIGSDQVYDGFFAQHGVIRAHSTDDLLPIAELFQTARPWGAGRIGAISISGALAAYMADRMVAEKLEFAELAPRTMERLATTSEYASAGNPFDPSGIVISKPQIFVDTLDAFLSDPAVDVLLDIADAAALRAAHARLIATVRARQPDTRIEGVLVQRMAPGGIDVILGAKHEPGFGPALMVGIGGVLAEALGRVGRVAVRPLPPTLPMHRNDAEALIDAAGLGPLLASARHGKPSDRPALVEAILALARLLEEQGAAIGELDINPLRVLPAGEGALALDAVIVPRHPATGKAR